MRNASGVIGKAALLLLLLLTACSPPTPGPDAGTPDAGAPAQQFCVGSSCNAAGTWRVVFTAGTSTNPVCQPVDDQILLTSDGGTVCMQRASDGGTDGGCGLQFVIAWSSDAGTLTGTDTWDIGIPDAGHLYGTWATHVTGLSSCDATFSIHGTR